MFHRGRERGEGNLGCILWALLLIVAVVIALEAVPVKIQSAELYDFMLEQARLHPGDTAETIRNRILARAKELEIPLSKKDLKVSRSRDRIRIEASYTLPVELPGYTYLWDFHHEIDRPIFYI